jgi:hypothetical protein
MERRSVLCLAGFGISLVTTGVLPAFSGGELPPKAELDRLDAAIQARFQITDTRKFGISRIPTKHPAMQRMEPQTDGEKSVLRSLSDQSWAVVLYAARPPMVEHLVSRPDAKTGASTVAGARSALVEQEGRPYQYRTLPDGKRPEPLLVMVGPLQLTERPATAPKLTADNAGVKKLLAQAMSGKEARLEVDRWQLVARPVRAGNEACVSCHAKMFEQKVKVGDPLGVAVYAFTPAVRK